ncbi:hypothetical protein P154DRAFT_623439 [Amniculicola lignicola CBS 123094]|uniref:Uncharacterized protein n=1 Tax=Amniculicola lignicola CBS 123094 TaxID=1392246 RepID=A0A6A5W313_9PLEO|nr:hypothetical protein P154DRAFT_623439 [Amniculicola lignicola CBS 123094]
MHALFTLIPALFALQTTALVYPRQDCSDLLEYRNVVVGDAIAGAPTLVGGVECEAGCELANGVAHAETTEVSFSISFSVGLDLGKVFSVGVEAGFSIAWATTDETSSSATVTCEGDGYVCGARVTTSTVFVSGEARLPPGGLGCAGDNDWHPFSVKSTELINDTPHMVFGACVISCDNGDAADICAAANNLPVCPAI